ncbi:MAG: fibronectin type III domain-containing protein, partial [Spirochaetota bacterium]
MKVIICLFILAVAIFFASCGGTILEEPPVSLEGLPAIEIKNLSVSTTENSATITWTTDIETTHLVEYGTESGVYSYATLPSVTAETSHSVSLTELSSGTTYYYRVHNYSPIYPVSISGEQSFKTTTPTIPSPEQKLRGIWIIGGLSGSTFTPAIGDVDLYDPVSDTWYDDVTALPIPVSFAGATSCDGKIYVIGGFDTNGNVLSAVQIYSVYTGTWSSGTPMTQARANIDAVTVNGKIYVLGGTTQNADTGWAGSNYTYEYNPAGDSWTQKANFTGTLSNRLLLPFDDVIYNLGGRYTAIAFISGATSHDGFATTTNGNTQGTEVQLSAGRGGMSGAIYKSSSGPATIVIVGGFSALSGTGGSYVFRSLTGGTSVNFFQYLYFPFTSPSSWQTVTTHPYPLSVGFGSGAIYDSYL